MTGREGIKLIEGYEWDQATAELVEARPPLPDDEGLKKAIPLVKQACMK